MPLPSCYCGSELTFADCCQPYIQQRLLPNTAEALMRSRYSAFCSGALNYLIFTRHPSTRHLDDRSSLQRSLASTQWNSLRVIANQQCGDRASVEFVAFFNGSKNTIDQIHEQSSFILEAQQWYYVDGKHLPPIKLQRNDPCWCGSGKKLKKCCS